MLLRYIIIELNMQGASVYQASASYDRASAMGSVFAY